MKSSQIKFGVILSYCQMAILIIIELFFTPVMLQALGKNEYGLYNTVASTISMLSILNLGFNSSYVKFFSIYKANNEKEKIYRLNGMLLAVFSVIGGIALVCGLFLTRNLHFVFSDGLTPDEYVLAKKLMLLLTINLAVSFPMGIFGNIITANEKFIFGKLVYIFKTIGGPLVSLPLLLSGHRSVAMVAATLAVSLLSDLLNVYYVFSVIGDRFYFRHFENGLLRDIFVYTSFIAINIIVDQINSNVDNVILGRYKGTEEVSVYSIGFIFYKCYKNFSQAISGIFTPRIHDLINENDEKTGNDLITDLFIKVGRIQFLVLTFVFTSFIFFGKPFIELWAGKGFEKSYIVTILLLGPATIPFIQNLGIEIQRAKDLHRFRALAYLFMAIINIVLSVFLAQSYGAIGSTIGTSISLILANGIVMNIYYDKKCGIDICKFWANIAKESIGVILPVFAGVLLKQFTDIKTIGEIIIYGCMYAAVYFVSFFIFGMNRQEKDQILQIVKRR